MEQGKKEAVSPGEVLCALQPETFLSPEPAVGGWIFSRAPSLGAQRSFPFLSEGGVKSVPLHSGSPKVGLREAWLQRLSASFACNLVRVVCQALGQTLVVCDSCSHHISQAAVVIPILHVSSLSYRHSVFAQGHSVRHRTKIQAWGFLSFCLIQSLMGGSQEI